MNTTDIKTRKRCDTALTQTAQSMLDYGAGMEMVIDRLITFALAHAVRIEGAFATAEMMRDVADNLERGAFAHLEPTKAKGH